jgi:diguanylate cyclase (GGDEF)-like protein/PAS domain S-box-containing protein
VDRAQPSHDLAMGPDARAAPHDAPGDGFRPGPGPPFGRARIEHAWTVAWDRASVRRLVAIGLPALALLMLLTALDAGGYVVPFENAHWTLAGFLAFAIAFSAARRTRGRERRLRLLVALATGCWVLGQLSWDIQTAAGIYAVPAPSDLGYLLMLVPAVAAFGLAVKGRLPRVEELAVYLDAAAIFLAISAAILTVYGDLVARGMSLGDAVVVAYPILHLAMAGAGLVALLAIGSRMRLGGGYLVLTGVALLGIAWIEWLNQAMIDVPASGSSENYLFSVGIVCVGLGGATWHLGHVGGVRSSRAAAVLHGFLPLIALVGSAELVVIRHLHTPDVGLVDVVALAVILIAGVRQTLLVHQRGRLLDDSTKARNDLEVALIQRAEADSRYRTLVEQVPAVVYIDIADRAVSDGGRLAYMSPQIERILGYPPEAFIVDPELWPSRIHPDDHQAAVAAYADHWATAQPLRTDYRMIARDGSVVWVHDEAYAMPDEYAGDRRVSQGLLVDTTDQKRLEAQLVHDALHDPLTGLANRVLFRDHLERALASRRPPGTSVALLFLDLDDFKVVNDSLGHRAGDRLLVEVAERLSGVIRAGDIAARLGGDEFTILLDRVDGVDDAIASAERVATELGQPLVFEGRSIVIGVSVGIALASDPETAADDLLAHADAAMYAAKGDGKARYAVFDPSMRVRAMSRLEMESELRSAIEREAFELHYQPIVELSANRIVGLEALVRWRHPIRGLIPPHAFIPLAEATGLIVPIGRIVTAAACRELRAFRAAAADRAELTMSVNVSPRQAIEPGFAAEIAGVLAATGLEPSALTLEITESLMLHESAVSDGSLRQLRDLGVQLVVDDFGTGFSALEYFKRFAINGLKIDRSFVEGLGRSRADTAIVTATLAFASALGLSVTAEGVATADQLARLRTLGCGQAQGYLFARPVPAAEVFALLARPTLGPDEAPSGIQAA